MQFQYSMGDFPVYEMGIHSAGTWNLAVVRLNNYWSWRKIPIPICVKRYIQPFPVWPNYFAHGIILQIILHMKLFCNYLELGILNSGYLFPFSGLWQHFFN